MTILQQHTTQGMLTGINPTTSNGLFKSGITRTGAVIKAVFSASSKRCQTGW
jgi:hypothetical protein